MMSFPASAQWQVGGRVIGHRNPGNDRLAVAHVGNASTVVAWNGAVSPGFDYDVVAQLVDSAGYDRWPAGGLVVYSDDGITQRYPAVLPDGNGGAFVAWTDWRNSPVAAIYGQHIDSSGNFLWDPQGVRLTFSDSVSHRKPQLLPDGFGGIIAVYYVTPIVWSVTLNLGAQRIDGEGVIRWDSAGILLTIPAARADEPKTVQVDDTSFVTLWLDWRFELHPEPDSQAYGMDLYMQRFDISGNIHWGQGGAPAVHDYYDQGNLEYGHDLVPDGVGGCVTVWVDWRHIGYNTILYADR